MVMVEKREEQRLVAMSMEELGGSFVSRLGKALIHADRDNAQRIKAAFPEYWEEHLDLAKKRAAEVELDVEDQ